jgi:hypothetical protein
MASVFAFEEAFEVVVGANGMVVSNRKEEITVVVF